MADLSAWLNARESSALVQSETAEREGTLRWVAAGRAEAYRDVLDFLDAGAGVANIARCPEHGLHGCRNECFVCGQPVEQVPMVKL